MTAAGRRHPSIAVWRVLGALALTACLGAGSLAESQTAVAATSWLVGRTGPNGGAGRAVAWNPPTGVTASCAAPITWNINISWQRVPHAMSYTVTRHGSSGGTVGSTTGTSLSDTQLSLLGVGSYYYTVTATLSNWTSLPSATTGTVTLYTVALITYCSG